MDTTPKRFSQFAHIYHAAPVAPQPRPLRKSKTDSSKSGAGRASSSLRSKTRKHKSERTWSISKLLDEASREPEASKHVGSPQVPEWLIGSRRQVETRAYAWHAQARKSDGKSRYQQNSPALAAIVVSLNRELAERWQAYRSAVLRYFRSEYGDRLVGAVNHDDEAEPHLHVYVVPRDGEDFGSVHPGYGASRTLRRMMPADAKEAGRQKREAYVGAMKAWLDRLYQATADVVGIERFGPRRRRLSRDEHLILKRSQEDARKLTERAQAESDAIVRRAKEIQAEAEAARRELNEVIVQQKQLRQKNLADARILQIERERLEASEVGQMARQMEQLTAELAKAHADLSQSDLEIDKFRFQQRMAKEAADKKSATVSVLLDENGRQVRADNQLDRFANGGRAPRPPFKPIG